MSLWLIQPTADPDDPAWQGRPQWERVIVRAASPAFARVVARTLDTTKVAPEYGDEHPHLGSGFADEKLYAVTPLTSPGGYKGDGLDEILFEARRLS
jgi:hypothetical protein